MSVTYEALLRVVIEDYQKEHGVKPKRLRANIGFKWWLFRELKWHVMVHDPEYGKLHPMSRDTFEYRGVSVKCDLRTRVATILAESEDPAAFAS